jgi:2-succinyl-5-enolpyruvyl-6-hydroxy-3-cyclohexene-1-carboxylate synthase
MEQATWHVIDDAIETGDYFDGAVVYDVVDLIPEGSTLFAGNSLPVRHLDGFGRPNNKRIYTYANRGASGIDGNISTALGAGAARPDTPLVAILGDITFYHDMNGLLAVRRCGVPVTIILLNNDGGGIFHRLPIRNFEPEFTDYFITRHGLDFSHAAALYGLNYIRADTRTEFRDVFQQQMTHPEQSAIIEVRTDSLRDNERRQQIIQQVQQRIRDLD